MCLLRCQQIKEEIRKSFALYWVDISSCANRIRSGVEMLLTQQQIPIKQIGKNGKDYSLSLHERIVLFQQVNPQAATHLLAIKWIGNAGSHSSRLSEEDVLDSYEILEYVLDDLFEKRAERVAKLSAQINSYRGPKYS